MASSSGLSPYKAEFLKACIDGGVLKFGSFELKSKRISPYFFNAGDFYSGDLVEAIGKRTLLIPMSSFEFSKL